jgi:hypothetical protein
VPSPGVDQRPPTALELALQHHTLRREPDEQQHRKEDHRGPFIVLLILFPVVCWAWIVVMARDVYGPMTSASASMMTLRWDVRHVLLLWMMWAGMQVRMLTP